MWWSAFRTSSSSSHWYSDVLLIPLRLMIGSVPSSVSLIQHMLLPMIELYSRHTFWKVLLLDGGRMSGPGVSVCKPRYNTIIWRAENRTHLSKQTRPSTERSRKASNVRGIPFRPDDPLRWVLIARTQV